ncbi:hypothetical protein [Streptomyces sp. NPDC005407]|uniref:hypothetical protein n=1 Tax=Streptomyces sp. NPDC005407 TaxID=3155340 RepID=UPI0033B0140C
MSETILTVITILGAVLTLGGLAFGARRLRSEYKELSQKLDEVTRINFDQSLTSGERNAQRHAILVPSSTLGDVEYFREWVRCSILQQAASNLGWPAALTALGVVLSTVASAWGVWV